MWYCVIDKPAAGAVQLALLDASDFMRYLFDAPVGIRKLSTTADVELRVAIFPVLDMTEFADRVLVLT
jgi:hypothetical protein